MMHGHGKSDSLIGLMKPRTKPPLGLWEAVEERAPAKGGNA